LNLVVLWRIKLPLLNEKYLIYKIMILIWT